MAEKEVQVIEHAAEQAAQEECCAPGCSPETCGAPAAEALQPVVAVKAEEECCAPECGPETCG